MKQTLESATDYGALRLDGDNVSLTSATQLLSISQNGEQTDTLTIEIELADRSKFKNTFKKSLNEPIKLIETVYFYRQDEDIMKEVKCSIDMNTSQIFPLLPQVIKLLYKSDVHRFISIRYFCFIIFALYPDEKVPQIMPMYDSYIWFAPKIQAVIYVQGFRSLERVLPVTGVGQNFSGDFVKYVASLIHSWQESKCGKLEKLNADLVNLKLAKKIEANIINDTQIELKVSRTMDSDDMVNIVDVGSGVSQILPVLVALVVAEPDQLVYLEEPEIHLHPLAQANLGEIIVNAANRGVRVVLETHSDLLLRRIQSLVAEDKIAPDKAILHWFSRDEAGFTKIISTALNETGAYDNSDFPLDFTDVFLDEEGRYLDAASAKRWKEQNEH